MFVVGPGQRPRPGRSIPILFLITVLKVGVVRLRTVGLCLPSDCSNANSEICTYTKPMTRVEHLYCMCVSRE
ncbi:hypothetical protein C8Q79DRAFT_235435 [Trametes meyenii]|nr:hypothetical protein C8Q79DRAFT_235435 [Trametes meyenii]